MSCHHVIQHLYMTLQKKIFCLRGFVSSQWKSRFGSKYQNIKIIWDDMRVKKINFYFLGVLSL